MRELLRSHENDIVDQVVLCLQSQNPAASSSVNQAIPVTQDPSHQVPVMDPGLLRITELENQLARLRAERDYAQAGPPAARQLGAYNLISPPATLANRELICNHQFCGGHLPRSRARYTHPDSGEPVQTNKYLLASRK